jgi:hypothetical protein
MPLLTTQWICLGENPEVLFTTESSLPDNSMYPLAAPINPPTGLGSAADANTSYEFAFWNVNGNLISGETVLIPVGTQPVTATAWYHLVSTLPGGYSYACSVAWFSLGQDRPFTNEDSEGWQSPIETVDGQAWNDEPTMDTDDSAHDIVLKQFMGNELFHSVQVMSGSPTVNGRNIHVNFKAKNVGLLAFYEPFGQAQFQNLKQVLAKIRLPWKELAAPSRREVAQLSGLIKRARQPGPLPPALLRELSASLKRIKVDGLKKGLREIEETLFQIEAARFLTNRAAGSRRP